MRTPVRLLASLAVVATVALSACSSSTSGSPVSVVGFSVAKGPYDALQVAYDATSAGKGTTIQGSYGASGDQSRAVIAGQKADIVHFSLETDMTKVVDAGLVAKDWNAGPTKGFASDSVVVFVVRKGNPLHLSTWDDIVKQGVKIVSPNPGSSGSARWNILAAYGHVLADGGSAADAKAYLTSFFEHVVALPGSGREATTAFTNGTGDVLISYENEAIAARAKGAKVDYVVPADTILIQNPAALTKTASKAAKDLFAYELSKAGQEVFAANGFRPVVDGVDVKVDGANDPSHPFPTPAKLFTIDGEFGGWAKAAKEFFDPKTGLVPAVQKQTGNS